LSERPHTYAELRKCLRAHRRGLDDAMRALRPTAPSDAPGTRAAGTSALPAPLDTSSHCPQTALA
jgi:hypothetical protein